MPNCELFKGITIALNADSKSYSKLEDMIKSCAGNVVKPRDPEGKDANYVISKKTSGYRVELDLGEGFDLNSMPILNSHWVEDSLDKDALQPIDSYQIHLPSLSASSSPARKRKRSSSQPSSPVPALDESILELQKQGPGPQDDAVSPPGPDDMPPWQDSNWCIQKGHPLRARCPKNQIIIDNLKVLEDYRRLVDNNDKSALAYGHAIAALKAYPEPYEENSKISGIGKKVDALIKQFRGSGVMDEVERCRNDAKYDTLKLFTKVYGIGPGLARELYANGLRTMAEVAVYDGGKFAKAVSYVDDLDKPIPRKTVEDIHDAIRFQLEKRLPGVKTCIVGGYRRGKSASNDVDILCTHPDGSGRRLNDALHEVVQVLTKKGFIEWIITESMSNAQRDKEQKHTGDAGTRGHLNKVFMIFKWPKGSAREHEPKRRVDLLTIEAKHWGSAVVGWTGSTLFERDLRRQANKLGYKFDSKGIVRLDSNVYVETPTEQSVFDILKINYIHPHYRNANA